MKQNLVIAFVATALMISPLAIMVATPLSVSESPYSHVQGINPDATFVGTVYIYPNGTVSAPSAIAYASGVYSLQENINGSVYVEKSGVVLDGSGLQVNGMGSLGVFVADVSGVTVQSLKVNYSNYAFDITNSTNDRISGNVITNSSTYGVSLSITSNVTVSGNTFTGVSYQTFVYVQDSTYTWITGNKANFTGYGGTSVYAASGSYLSVSDNVFNDQVTGVTASHYTSVHLDNNTISGTIGTAISLTTSTGFSTSFDTVVGAGYPIDTTGVTGVSVMHDNFNGSTLGVVIVSSSNISLLYSDFSNVTSASEDGIALVNSFGINISNDIFNESANTADIGIYITGAVGTVRMYNDTVYSLSGAGMDVSNSESVSVMNCTIQATPGIVATGDVNGFVAEGNTLSVPIGGTGIQLAGTSLSSITVSNNSISSASGAIGYGVILSSPTSMSNVVVTNNLVHNATNAFILSTTQSYNILFSHNQAYNVATGLNSISIMNSVISDNVFHNVSNSGLIINTATGLMVTGNSLYLNHTGGGAVGIESSQSANSVISGNFVTLGSGNSGSGIIQTTATNATVSFNIITNVQAGIQDFGGFNTEIYGNTVSNSIAAIETQLDNYVSMRDNYVWNTSIAYNSASDTLVSVYGNTFMNVSTYSLELSLDSHVTIYHNNFIDGSNIHILVSASSDILWNLSAPIGGNYWSNYTGSGSNGLGTTPLNILPGYWDYLPLTSRWIAPTVTFVESGLPSGTMWSVSLGGNVHSSTTDSITFYDNNGGYVNSSYTVAPVSGYVSQSSSGSVYLNGENKTVNLQYSPKTYAFTLTESGLPIGASWSATVGAKTLSSIDSAIVFNLPNGTYSYSAGGATGYSTNSSGSVVIASGPASAAVAFAATQYTITVTEKGLPAGDTWTFTLDGKTYNSNESTMVIYAVSGAHNISASGPSGYSIGLQGTNLTVDNANTTFAVSFTQKGSSAIYAGIGIGAVIGVAAMFIASYLITGTLPLINRKLKPP